MTISSDDTVWITQRLALTEQGIVAIETAIAALVGGAQSYELDTGDNRTRVTRASLDGLAKMLQIYEERRTRLRTQLGLPNTVGVQTRVVPAF